MTQRTEAEIRAEIELCQSDIETSESNIGLAVTRARRNALTWVLSASPSPVAGDDEIVEAMVEAAYDAEFGHGAYETEKKHRSMLNFVWPSPSFVIRIEYARRALATARPLIERAVRASADAEIAELRASLAKAEEDKP